MKPKTKNAEMTLGCPKLKDKNTKVS